MPLAYITVVCTNECLCTCNHVYTYLFLHDRNTMRHANIDVWSCTWRRSVRTSGTRRPSCGCARATLRDCPMQTGTPNSQRVNRLHTFTSVLITCIHLPSDILDLVCTHNIRHACIHNVCIHSCMQGDGLDYHVHRCSHT